MPRFLTKDIADALCTVITLGFARKQMDKTKKAVVFQYDEDPGEKYKKVQDLFKMAGVDIDIGKSGSQDNFPYILGTSFPEGKKENLKNSLLDFKADVDNMMSEANKTAPKGAYIGILCTVDNDGGIVKAKEGREISLYGPSALSQYKPKYRSLSDEERTTIDQKYKDAIASTNSAVAAILDGLAAKGVKKIPGYEFTDSYDGGLFSSCHGMIRAMVNRSDPPDDLFNVYAELALGAGTRKVSSCVPCAIFMESFGYPASSIHLGRGDNWGLPKEIDQTFDGNLKYTKKNAKKQWKQDIVTYFYHGLEAFRIGGALRLHVKNKTSICELATSNGGEEPFGVFIEKMCRPSDYNEEIPEIFLEALTFEDSFTERILNTFKAVNIKTT
jgi:hypothetical protein